MTIIIWKDSTLFSDPWPWYSNRPWDINIFQIHTLLRKTNIYKSYSTIWWNHTIVMRRNLDTGTQRMNSNRCNTGIKDIGIFDLHLMDTTFLLFQPTSLYRITLGFNYLTLEAIILLTIAVTQTREVNDRFQPIHGKPGSKRKNPSV